MGITHGVIQPGYEGVLPKRYNHKPTDRVLDRAGEKSQGKKVGLGYVDPVSIDMDEWQEREDQGILFVEKAGETLYLLENASQEVTIDESDTYPWAKRCEI